MARSPLHILTITVLVLAVAAVYILMGATAAGASPGLTVGIAGNQFIDNPVTAEEAAADLNLGGVRVFLEWHGERNVSEGDRARLTHLPRRSLVSVYGWAADVPRTPAARANFAAYVAQVVGLFHPWAVSVWNEPNLPAFWEQDGHAAEDYTRLLARTYDAVKRVDRAVLVLGGETVRSYGVDTWVKRMGREYRKMRRSKTRKLMDGFAHHPYPVDNTQPAWMSATPDNKRWMLQGDVQRLRTALEIGFRRTPQRRWTPIYWTETGWSREAFFGGPAISGEDQGIRIAEAVELAYCQRRVRSIFFFSLWDQGGWNTTVLQSDHTRKPSFASLATAIANVNTGNVNCSRFPAASL